jgi:signal transduction histidine kinase
MMASEQPQPSPPPEPCQQIPRIATPLELKLKEAKQQEKQLRHITRKILVATEAARGTISHHLHDEIAQALLGIHVRLLALKQEAVTAQDGFTRELDTTQRLVIESVQTINRYARKLAHPDEKQIP